MLQAVSFNEYEKVKLIKYYEHRKQWSGYSLRRCVESVEHGNLEERIGRVSALEFLK